jgi:hypothetical protein
MTFIVRLPAILALLVLVVASLGPAIAATLVLTGLPFDLAALIGADAAAQLRADSAASTWLEVGLWYGAGVMFLIAAIRLMRRTQGFWLWLLGFACFGARWAVPQENGPLETIKNLDLNNYLKPDVLMAASTSSETQLGLLGIVVVVGLMILIVDAADRSHWNRQEG